MSQPAWFGLSHDRAWGDVGQSFADLNSRDGHLEACKTATGETAAAGTRSSAKPKGAGSFQLQTEWRLAAGPQDTLYCTEASERFKQPPQCARPAVSQAAKGKSTSFPKETYPPEFRTSKQQDFDARRLVNMTVPVRPIRPKDSGTATLIQTCDPEHTSRTRPAKASVQNIHTCALTSTDTMGKTRLVADTRMPVFNIITGSAVPGADRMKYWNGQRMDYRRKR